MKKQQVLPIDEDISFFKLLRRRIYKVAFFFVLLIMISQVLILLLEMLLSFFSIYPSNEIWTLIDLSIGGILGNILWYSLLMNLK